MIAQLQGVVANKSSEFIHFLVGQVAFKVYLPFKFLAQVKEKDKLSLFTQLAVREDKLTLYGFEKLEELQLFELLLGVGGVGPKMALGVISAGSVDEITQAIQKSDLKFFTRVSGIGKKNAGRIILELKAKLSSNKEMDLSQLEEDPGLKEVEAALRNLGYAQREIRPVMARLDRNLSLEDKIKAALRSL